ncbi:hypothetical protein IWW37_000978 [Coemansia sp. RSA 2050]|nr:hypothetical protein IWW37_000978 [Coemansia sp. RSA 2050]KAJ2736203.1 hypothetical protein IW152_000972 [Coemansia sp. BCRC 34962]
MEKFRALYFASARDAAQGKQSEILEVADKQPATLAAAVERIRAAYPRMEPVLKSAMVALNEKYCDQDDMASTEIKDKDTVAIIPPVSGG